MQYTSLLPISPTWLPGLCKRLFSSFIKWWAHNNLDKIDFVIYFRNSKSINFFLKIFRIWCNIISPCIPCLYGSSTMLHIYLVSFSRNVPHSLYNCWDKLNLLVMKSSEQKCRYFAHEFYINWGVSNQWWWEKYSKIYFQGFFFVVYQTNYMCKCHMSFIF